MIQEKSISTITSPHSVEPYTINGNNTMQTFPYALIHPLSINMERKTNNSQKLKNTKHLSSHPYPVKSRCFLVTVSLIEMDDFIDSGKHTLSNQSYSLLTFRLEEDE